MGSFDGADYTGSSTSPSQHHNFLPHGLPGTVADRAFLMETSFFKGPGNAVNYSGGITNNTNTDCIAGDTFAAKR